MGDPARGEIWLVAFESPRRDEPAKDLPAVVVSVDEISAGLEDDLIVIVPLSSSRAPSLLRPKVSRDAGIERDSVAICRGLRGMRRKGLLRQVGKVNADTLSEIEQALGMILGID